MDDPVRPDQECSETLKDAHKSVSIATFAGAEVFPFDPKPEQIFLEDLAHALAMKCRFTGHTRFHYSVAQHSVLMVKLALNRGMSKEVQQFALLHDASEAYLPDVASPLKKSLLVTPGRAHPLGGPTVTMRFREAEKRLSACIYARFGLINLEEAEHTAEPPEIAVLDAHMYHGEKFLLMPDVRGFEAPRPPRDMVCIYRLPPEHAKESFIYQARRLELHD
jgi:hypothetical protein